MLVAEAVTRDVPIYLEGLGSVTAYKTVNVRTQVDGRLDAWSSTRGRRSSAASCWRRSTRGRSQIQLHQAEAALARDRRS